MRLLICVLVAGLAAGCVIPLPSSQGGRTATGGKIRDDAPNRFRESTPSAHGRHLRNPDYGWAAYCGETYQTISKLAPAGKPPLEQADVVIVRAPLSEWEASGDRPEDSPAASALESWAGAGGRAVGLRIDSARKADLPAHLAGSVPVVDDVEGKPPLFSDGEYIAHHQRLLNRLAKRFEAIADRVSIVIVGGADWNTPAEWKQIGLGEERHRRLVLNFCDMYRKAFAKERFPYARLFLPSAAVTRNPSGGAAILHDIRQMEIGLLADTPSAAVLPGEWADHRTMLGEGFAGVLDGAGADEAIDAAVRKHRPLYIIAAKAPVGGETWGRSSQADLARRADRLDSLAARIGPRPVVTKAVAPIRASSGQPFRLDLTWENRGGCAPLEPWRVQITFLDPSGAVFSTLDPEAPVDEAGKPMPIPGWGPGFVGTMRLSCPAPKLPPAQIVGFKIAVSLVHAENPRRRFELPLAERSKDGRSFVVAEMEVQQ